MKQRSITIGAAIFAILLIAASAQAAECTRVTIEGGYITDQVNAPGIFVGMGDQTYLQYQIGEWDGVEGGEGFGGESSVEIPSGDTVATVCPDGTVSFETAQVTVVEPNEGVEDLTPVEAAEVEAGGTDVPDDRIAWNFLTNAG
jgi:hypothetical protein